MERRKNVGTHTGSFVRLSIYSFQNAKDAYSRTLETTVYVSPEYTGRGIGKQLMNELIRICRERNFLTLIACITEGNESSFRLHEKLGFERVSHFKKVGMKFGKYLDVIDYELIL